MDDIYQMIETVQEVLNNLDQTENEELHLAVEIGYHFLDELKQHAEEM